MAQLLEGKSLSQKIASELKEKISKSRSKPHLAIIQVGDDARSSAYIRRKIAYGQNIGARVTHHKFPYDISQSQLKKEIELLNSDPDVHGIIIQLPIPEHLDKEKIINTIDSRKDVDGLTSSNQDKLEVGSPYLVPATARGVMSLLKEYDISVTGKHVAVVGRSRLVGTPLAHLLRHAGARVTVCHRGTLDLARETREADIVIVAAGQKGLITLNHVNANQVIVDVGINIDRGNLVGDVDYDEVEKIVSAITPVPGGVGPMTVASLFENLVEAWEKIS